MSTLLGRLTASRSLRLVALAAVAFAGGAATSRATQADTAKSNPYGIYDEMARALVLIETSYVDPSQRQKIVEGAVRGMVAQLDPHSSYMNAKEYAEFRSDTEGRFAGIGVEVDFRGDLVTVISPMEGSPAEKAGVRAGDQIVSVDGATARGERMDKVVARLRGEAGTKVLVTLRRSGAPEPLELSIQRELIRVKSVMSKRLDGDVAYVRLRQFQEGCHEELLASVGKLRKERSAPLRGVILDLRFNPGGLVDEAEHIADEMLDGGVIYSTRHRGKVIDEVKASPGGALRRLPMNVLVNEYSASASELLAGALQDAKRATIYGAQTFGKGSVQTIFELPHGGGMRLTTMRYYTPSGRSIQALGITPDVQVVLSTPLGELVRERDLAGHLGEEEAPARKPIETVEEPRSAKKPEGHPMALSREVPSDPSKGADFTLALAYKRLISSLEGVK